MDLFWTAPPVTRTLTALTFVQSVLVRGGLVMGYHVLFVPKLIFFKLPPEIWRLVTPFLLTGPELDFVFDLYFMFKYGSALETNSHWFNSPGDFFTYVFFVATVIMLTAGVLLNNVIFTKALIMAFVYTYAQDNRGKKAGFFMLQIPVQFLPWAILTVTLVRFGWPTAVSESMGIIAAHMHYFLTRLYPTFGGGKNYITTPAFVRRFFTTYTQQGESRSYGTAYRSPNQEESSSAGWTSSFSRQWSGDQWNGRGAGRRLGGG